MDKKIIVSGILLIIGSMLITGCISSQQESSTPAVNLNPLPQQSETEIFIPLSDLSENAKFYSYESDGITIRFFVIKDILGSIHVAFDACDVCYYAKKGYRQNGDVMHCINCGQEFPISGIGTDNIAGGCWPSYLPFTIEDDAVVISIDDITARQYMFR